MFTYICTAGHIESVPSMGTLDRCPTLMPVTVRYGTGWAPCGCGIVQVPHDPVLETAYKLGGPSAVLDLVRHRASEH